MTEQHLTEADIPGRVASTRPVADSVTRQESMTDTTSSMSPEDRSLLRQPTSLTRRLALLAVLFVMIAEVLIYVPSIARYQESWLQEKVTAAYLAVLLAEAMPGFMIDDETKSGLLDAAGVMSIDIYRDDKKVVELTPLDMDVMPDRVIDLRKSRWYHLIAGSFRTLFDSEDHVISLLAPSPKGEVLVRVMIAEAPLRQAMYDHSTRIFVLSLIISTITAILLVMALRWQIVRPVKSLIHAMLHFTRDPANPDHVFHPTHRRDEIGSAEMALNRLQKVVRQSLRQQQRLAELGTAVSKISHDLRNILATAHLLADHLEESADPNVRRIAPRVIASLDRAHNLCTESMRFGSLEEPEPHAETFALAPLVQEVAVAAGAAPVSDVAVQARFDAGLTLYADREMMFRILLNLMRNAVQALTRHKTVNPEITLTIDLHKNGQLSLILSDNGPGLPAKALENLFRPFHGSTGQGGTGLGLVISRDLCRAQKGDLTLLSSDKTGTRFVITLPGT